MKRPRLTGNIVEGLLMVISLAGEDMAADEKRDWGHAKAALDYLQELRTWWKQRHDTTSMYRVKQVYPQAYCVERSDVRGFLVWPGKVGPRGTVTSALGSGATAKAAWNDAMQRLAA